MQKNNSNLQKLGNKDDPTNYRPISLLSNINKIFERLMYNRLITFIERNNVKVLYSSQYVFVRIIPLSMHICLATMSTQFNQIDGSRLILVWNIYRLRPTKRF